MNLRIGICDDNALDIETLANHIEHYDLSYQTNLDVETFLSGEDLLHAHHADPFNILFLDIEMPKQSGLKLARFLRDEAYDDMIIIFVTSYPEYMRDSFDVQPYQFLIKPAKYPTVERLLSNILARYERSNVTKIILDHDDIKHVIYLKDLIYVQTIKSDYRFLEYHLTTRTITGDGIINELEDNLAEHGFVSPCRGCVINIRHVQKIQDFVLYMSNGEQISISRRKKKQIQQIFANRIIQILN